MSENMICFLAFYTKDKGISSSLKITNTENGKKEHLLGGAFP